MSQVQQSKYKIGDSVVITVDCYAKGKIGKIFAIGIMGIFGEKFDYGIEFEEAIALGWKELAFNEEDICRK